ncbi:MAG TPA: sigma-70 family RNA polymerase sigma factor [Aggregatilineales bacterium]|nr:sigma-70 family RNA polymerase sigma factor [Aggregatilineales bacterium]
MGFVLPDTAFEDKLLLRARQGDQRAISEIYERFFPPVFAFIRIQVEKTDLAEDIASEVFIRLVETIGGRSGPQQNLRGWLFTVARNQIHSHYGKTRRIQMTSLDDDSPLSSEGDLEIETIRSLDVERARQALRQLLPEQREVLIFRFIEALSLEETSTIMGKSVSAVKSLQFRALNALRRLMGEVSLGNL